jgi:DNA adenine methylase
LLDVLSGVRGKFLLSGFPNAILREYVDGFGWSYVEIEMGSPAKRGKNTKGEGQKIEALCANFPQGTGSF